MGATRGGPAPQRGFGGKIAQAMAAKRQPATAGGAAAKAMPPGFLQKIMAAMKAQQGGGARGPAAPPPGGPVGGGGGMAAGGPATISAMPAGQGQPQASKQQVAGAMGGWNANPQLIKDATNYLKGGAELAPAQRGSLDRLVRQTDQPMVRPAVARPGGWGRL